MKAAFKTVFAYVLAVAIIGVFVSMILAITELLFTIIDLLILKWNNQEDMFFISTLYKALALCLMGTGLAFLAKSTIGLTIGGIKGAFKGAAQLGSGLAKTLNFTNASASSAKDFIRKNGGLVGAFNALDGKKLNQVGRSLRRMGINNKGFNKLVRAKNRKDAFDELGDIVHKGSDGKEDAALMDKERISSGFNLDALQKDAEYVSTADSESVSEKERIEKQPDFNINIVQAAQSNADQVGFNNVEDGLSVPYIHADNLILPNGFPIEELIDSVSAYNGETKRHVLEAGQELGALDAQAKDIADESRENNQELALYRGDIPGQELQDRAMNVSRTSTENSNFFNGSTADQDVAAIPDAKAVSFVAASNGEIGIDDGVSSTWASQSATHMRMLQLGQAGLAAGTVSENDIAASAALSAPSELERLGDTIARNPMYGRIANRETTDSDYVDDTIIRMNHSDNFNNYVDGMNNPDIIDMTQDENGVFTATDLNANTNTTNSDLAHIGEEVAQQSNTQAAQQVQADNVAGVMNDQFGNTQPVIDQSVVVNNVVNNEYETHNNGINEQDIMKAMESGFNKTDMSDAFKGMLVGNMLGAAHNDAKVDLSEDTLMKMQRIQERVIAQDRKMNERQNNNLENMTNNGAQNVFDNSVNNVNNTFNANINKDIKDAASSYAKDYKSSNPSASEEEVADIKNQIMEAMSKASKRTIEQSEEREQREGLRRMKQQGNDGKA